MKTFSQYVKQREQNLEEGWLGDTAKDAWDYTMGRDLPGVVINKYLQRLHSDSSDVGSWKKLIQSFKRLGKAKEAEILSFALNEGDIKLVTNKFDPRGGFQARQLTFEFYPRASRLNQWDARYYYASYTKLWQYYGSPVEKVGSTIYWDKEEKVEVPVYGIRMTNPAENVNLWPDQRSPATTTPAVVSPPTPMRKVI